MLLQTCVYCAYFALLELISSQVVVGEESKFSFSSGEINLNAHSRNEHLELSAASRYAGVALKPFDDNVHYRINWLSDKLKAVPSLEIEKDSQKQSNAHLTAESGIKTIVHDDNTLWITTADKEKYHCELPDFVSKPQKEQLAGSKYDKTSPYQLLKPLITEEVCSYRLESYWTYELCHGRYIRQFHEESTVQKIRSQEYYLGKFDVSLLPIAEAEFEAEMAQLKKQDRNRPTIPVDGVQVPFIELNMTGGTVCDLNNKPRFTRVFYVCNEESKHELYSIKEIFTCEYEAVVLSPLICRHSDLRITTTPEVDINCFPDGTSPAKPKSIKKFEDETILQRAESLLDRKSIIIGASDIGREFKIDLQFKEAKRPPPSQKPFTPEIAYDSKILRNFVEGDLCLHGGTGWWKYRFCYGKVVEQYHEEKPGQLTTITLGKWNKDEHIKWVEKNNRKIVKGKTPRQVSHLYGGGDVCGVTGKPRQVEVKLKCQYVEGDPDSVALYLREPQPCEYVLGIESPLLCHLLSSTDEHGLMRHPDDMKRADSKAEASNERTEL